MSLYELVVFLHVAAAMALLGGSVIASPAVRRAAQRAETVHDVRTFLALGRPLLVLEPVSAVIVLASGIYLASAAGFWIQGWVLVAVGCWVVNAALAGAIVKPAMGRIGAEAAAAADGSVSPRLDALRRSSGWMVAGDVIMANDAAMVYVMTMKPGLAGSLIAVALAVLTVTAVRRRSLSVGSPERLPDISGQAGMPTGTPR